jgi:transcriptional regulator with PAS, ATPase and Fis domain
MANVHWEGPVPPPSLTTLLASGGFALVEPAAAEVVVVCTSAADRLPQTPGRGVPWLWASQVRLPPHMATQAALAGAYDSLWLGDADAPRRLLARLAELAVPEPLPAPSPTFVARSPSSRAALHQLARAARTSMPVLITGETGTGKEVTARLLHTWSERRAGRFVPINCAAIPNELMEGELFGYAKGAFSGATKGFDGQLMAAAAGTVFLDEIDDTPLSLQMKLLRVLEDRVVNRLGESEPKQVDFRIVAATNRNLRELIAQGVFGADLYERLAIVSIHLPPLRERREDMPPLIEHFIARFQREEPSSPQGPIQVTPEALAALEAYPWPGNIRELRNVLFEALVYKRVGQEILASDLPQRVLRRGVEPTGQEREDTAAMARGMDAGTFNLRAEVEALERRALHLALERSGGNASRAALLLGEVGRGRSADPGATVRAMMRRLNLSGTRATGARSIGVMGDPTRDSP